MRKLTSLLCALTLTLSIGAETPFRSPFPTLTDGAKLQQAQKTESAKLQQTQTTESAKLQKALKAAGNDKERKAIISRYKAAHNGQVPAYPAPAQAQKNHAPKAGQEATEVVITRLSTTLSVEDGTIFYGLHTDEFAPAFYFDLPLAEGTHDVELGRVYTLDEMNADACEWDDEDWNEHYYAAANFQKTMGNAYDVHIVATITDVDGVEWNLSYDEAPLVPTGETIDVNINRPLETMQYITSDGSWLLRARNSDYFVQLQYFSTDSLTPAGTFDAESIIFGDTYIEVPTGEYDDYGDPTYKYIHPKDGTVSAAISADGKRLDVSASLLCEDGKVYNITLFYALPEKESEAQLVATNLSIDEWGLELWGELALFASNDDGLSVGLNLYPLSADNWLATYEITADNSNNGYIAYNGEQFSIYSGTLNIAFENDKYVVTGTVLAWDNVEYSLRLTTPDPVITSMTFNGTDVVLDLYEEMGAWQIAGFDDEHENFLSIAVYSSEVAGHYNDMSLFEPQASYLAVGEAVYLLQSVDITVTYADGEAAASGTMSLVNQEDGLDIIELTVVLEAGPYQPSEHDLILSDFAFGYYDEGPDVYYELLEENSFQKFAFDIIVDRWSPDVEFGKTYTLDDMLINDSYGLNFYENTYIYYETVSFTKTKNDDNTVTILISVADTRGNIWNLSYTGDDKETDPVYVTLGQCNMFTHSENSIEYEMVDKDNSLKCVLVLNLTEEAESDSTYTTETIDLIDSYLSIRGTEYSLTDATFFREVDGETLYVSASVTDERGYQFRLSFYDDGFRPTGDTIKVEFDAEISVMYFEEYYQWNIRAENDSVIAHFSLSGSEDVFATGRQLADDASIWSSRIEFYLGYDEEDEEDKWLYVQLREIQSLVVFGSEGSYSLEAVVLAEDGNVYLIAVNKQFEAVDELSVEPAAAKRIIDGQLFIERNGVRYSVSGVRVK